METATAAVVFSEKPQISSQDFKFPGAPPIRQIPSIRGVLENTRTVATEAPVKAEVTAEPKAMEMPDAHEEPIPQEPVSPATVHLDTQAQAETSTTEPEDFATCWRTLFEDVFSATPMIYHPLKDKIPTLADGVIRIEVMNDFQKDQYEMRKRAVLEYWRNHFTINDYCSGNRYSRSYSIRMQEFYETRWCCKGYFSYY